jgi:hypothetical protein
MAPDLSFTHSRQGIRHRSLLRSVDPTPKVSLNFAQLADQCEPLVLHLADPLPRNVELIANLPKRVALPIQHARAHPEDVNRTVIKLGKLGLAESLQRGKRQVDLRNHRARHAFGSIRHQVSGQQAVAVIFHLGSYDIGVLGHLRKLAGQRLDREVFSSVSLVYLQDAEPERVP